MNDLKLVPENKQKFELEKAAIHFALLGKSTERPRSIRSQTFSRVLSLRGKGNFLSLPKKVALNFLFQVRLKNRYCSVPGPIQQACFTGKICEKRLIVNLMYFFRSRTVPIELVMPQAAQLGFYFFNWINSNAAHHPFLLKDTLQRTEREKIPAPEG